MARMIPPVIQAGCNSFGEREIFRKLRDEPGTRSWTVLHSLDLPQHIKKISGEIDFVVIVPGKGVLCIEVKACSTLARRDGLWFYGNDIAGDPRGPFKQAAQGMHSLRKQLCQERPDLSRVPFFTAVIFPYVNFDVPPEEWRDWEVIDRRRFRALPISTSILSVLDRWREHFKGTESASWFVESSKEPYPEQCTEIAHQLRGDFEMREDSRSIIDRNADELDRFTSEQFEALDNMENNERIVFSGAAGTGKTFLALESARREGEKGKRVLLVCFNRLLSEWLKSRAAAFANVEVTSLHALMVRLSGLTVSGNDSRFWEETLPESAIAAIIERPGADFQYDALIIDEGQDILHGPYLDLLDLLLKGGLSAGHWRMFGDFARQTIYKTSSLRLEEFKSSRCGGVPEVRLTVNCRNTPRIGIWAQRFGQLRPGYSRFRRPDNGVEPDSVFFKDARQQAQLIVKELEKLSQSGFSNQDIVLLSPYGFDRSVLSTIENQQWKSRIKPFTGKNQGYLGFSTIQAFKGLEAQVVIVSDFDKIDGPEDLSLLYIAVSRAVHKATLFFSESIKRKLFELVLGGDGEKV